MSAAVLHPDDDLSEGATLLSGRFRVQGLIGFGASGVVYTVTDTRSGDKVALKVLARHCVGAVDKEARFAREGRIGLMLAPHPNLVRVRDAGRLEDGRPFILLDHVRGPTLSQLAWGARLETAVLLNVARDLASGLAALHAQGIVHRDLKPANVLVDEDCTPAVARITDLGLAIEQEAGTGHDDGITRANQRPGTPIYMAPEQLAGVRAGLAADVYSLGATLYELAAGQRPYARVPVEEIVRAKLRGDPPGPPLPSLRSDLPSSFVELVDACMRTKPSERPDAESLAVVLGGTVWRGRSRSSRGRLAIGMLAVAGLGAASWVVFALPTVDDTAARHPQASADAIVLPPEPELAPSHDNPVVPAIAPPAPTTDEVVSPAETDGGSDAAPAEIEPSSPPDASTSAAPTRPTKPSVAVDPATTKPPHETQACVTARQAAEDARRNRAWARVLEETRDGRCWVTTSDRAKLRLGALYELGRFDECLREGAAERAPATKKIVEMCGKRGTTP